MYNASVLPKPYSESSDASKLSMHRSSICSFPTISFSDNGMLTFRVIAIFVSKTTHFERSMIYPRKPRTFGVCSTMNIHISPQGTLTESPCSFGCSQQTFQRGLFLRTHFVILIQLPRFLINLFRHIGKRARKESVNGTV